MCAWSVADILKCVDGALQFVACFTQHAAIADAAFGCSAYVSSLHGVLLLIESLLHDWAACCPAALDASVFCL